MDATGDSEPGVLVPGLAPAGGPDLPVPVLDGARVPRLDLGRLRRHGRAIALAAGAVAITVTYASLLLGRGTVDVLTREDGVYESVGAAAFLAAGVLLIRARSRRPESAGRLHSLVLLGLAALFLVAAGEEVSWGQRILGLETPPALERVNVQGETNMHNIEAVSGWGNHLLNALWLGFGLVLPAAAAASARARRALERHVPLVPLALGLLLLWNHLVSEAARALVPPALYHGSDVLGHVAVELKEANVALLFVLAAAALAARPGGRT